MVHAISRKIDTMKQILKTIIFLFIFSSSFAQEDSTIVEIRKNFKSWQPLIDSEIENCQRFYKYCWGQNYQFIEWYDSQNQPDSLTLHTMSLILEKENLGYFLYTDKFSLSGDWSIAVDYYFDIKGKLYFIFWRMNSFYAEIPVTVEKRLYFDNKGEKIRDLVSVYKMNTKEKTEVSYMDKDVEYKMDIKEFEVYNYWTTKKGNSTTP